MFKDAIAAHDELREALGHYWPETMETVYPPVIVKAILGCLGVGLCLLVVLAAGLNRSVPIGIGIVLLILVVAAYVQHRSYFLTTNAAWERFREEDPVAYRVAQQKYWGLP